MECKINKLLRFFFISMMILFIFNGCMSINESTHPSEDLPEELWILLDIPISNTKNPASTMIENLANGFEDSHENMQIRLDILPVNLEERDARLEQLRAEIMAGKGPDVYLVATDNLRSDDGKFVRPDSLFTDVTLSMYNGVFTDIGQYYDADDALGKDSLESIIMDAGVVDGARYVLPLFYDYPIIVTTEEKLAQSHISKDTLESDMGTIMEELLAREDVYLFSATDLDEEIFGFNLYSNLLDYDTGKVLITAEEIAEYMRLYQAKREIIKDTYLGELSLEEFVDSEQPFINTRLSVAKTYEECKIIPMRGLNGTLIADVDYWGAVGSSCANPTLAYEFLRMFLLEDFQWSGAIADAWPVRTKGYTLELDEEINVARFSITSLEREIYSMSLYKLNDSANGYAAKDMDIDALAEEIIQKLWWHIAEG